VSLLFCTFIGFLQLRHRTRFRDSFCLASVFKCLFTYLLTYLLTSLCKISLTSNNRLPRNGQKRFSIWRPSAILNFTNFHILVMWLSPCSKYAVVYKIASKSDDFCWDMVILLFAIWRPSDCKCLIPNYSCSTLILKRVKKFQQNVQHVTIFSAKRETVHCILVKFKFCFVVLLSLPTSWWNSCS